MEGLRLKADQADSVARIFECPACEDVGWEVVPGKGARPCPVCAEKSRQVRLLGVPEFHKYRDVWLETLEARPDRHPRQIALVKAMKEKPEASYALFGANQIGKTHLAWALYRHAIESGRSGIAVPAYRLLRELTELEFNEQARPALTADMLLRTSNRWCVFIDDLTALPRFSQFAVSAFYQIFNAVVQKGHQLLVTAHASESAIEEAFNQGGTNMGASIIGRIRSADQIKVPSGLMEVK